jgi:transcriptional regulator with XRE-family HTH domain
MHCLVATIWVIVAKTKSQAKRGSQELGPLLGKNVSLRRKTLGLTQAQLAERLGVETETISRVERGTNLISLQRLASLSEVLETSVAELLSQSVSNRSDQALMIEQWLLNLTPRERGFVVESVRQLCEHFAAPMKN